jgi:hypothetical protein
VLGRAADIYPVGTTLSSFPELTMISRATFRPTAVLFALLMCALLTGCKSKITKVNYDKISEGMSLEEVEKILGEGTKLGIASAATVHGVDLPGARPIGGGDTYIWESDYKKITIIFDKDKVKWKDSTGL